MVKKRLKFNFQYKTLTKKQRAVVLPAMIIVGAAAVVLAVWTISIIPKAKNPDYGVAANGFTAFIEQGTDLGVGKVVSKDQVATALGNKAKKITSTDISHVFNYDGDRSQTATYNFVRADGLPSSLYIDLVVFKDQSTMTNEDIFGDTELARVINGHSAYYMHAQTLGALREYRLLVVNGLKAYKFVIDQPLSDIKINEVAAVASLIKLAQVAKL
jgi:hypothetical protein